jgi:IS30 family transposase
LDDIEKMLCDQGCSFAKVFKTLTFDNGGEFKASLIERSCQGESLRTKVYFAHPYSSYERGSNENYNGFVRRFFHKGTDFSTVSQEQVAYVQNAINDYPRRILNYASANLLFASLFASP